MKVKNIAFSGFAAAILATSAASAAPQIASRQYVDDKVKADVQTLQTTIEKDYTTTEALPGVIAGEIAKDDSEVKSAIDTAIADKADKDVVAGLSTKVEGLESTVGDADSGLVKDVTTLKTDITGKADKLSGDAIKAGNVAVIDANGNYVAGTVASGDLVTNATVTEKITDALTNSDAVKNAVNEAVSNSDVVTDAITTSVESGALKTELDKKANVADVYSKTAADAAFAAKATTLEGYGITDAYTKTETDAAFAAKATTLAGYGITDAYTKTETYSQSETDAKIKELAVEYPEGECAAESGRCVLSFDKDLKKLMWLDVTKPLEETGSTGK